MAGNGGNGQPAPEPRRILPKREQGQGSGEADDQPEREDKGSGGTVTHGAYSTHAPTVPPDALRSVEGESSNCSHRIARPWKPTVGVGQVPDPLSLFGTKA